MYYVGVGNTANQTNEETKMKTSEILRTINDDIMAIGELWVEENRAIYKEIDQEIENHKQKLKELEEKRADNAWDAFEARHPDEIKLQNEAIEKMMTLIKSIDDERVKKWVRMYERGVITTLELMQQFVNETIHVSQPVDGQKTLTETNW